MKERIEITSVHMDYEAFNQAYEHAKNNVPYEIGGFVMGYVGRWKNEYYLRIKKVIPVKSKSTYVTVEFLSSDVGQTVSEINKIKTKYGYYILGWYHSHPGYTCKPSRLDLRSHITYFREPYQVGLIIDPLNDDHCIFRADSIFSYKLIPFYVWRRISDG